MSVAPAEQVSACLFETDFVTWLDRMADSIRHGASVSTQDRLLLAEEISNMARKDRKEIRSRAEILLIHLLKVRYQPDKQTRSWDLTILDQREELAELLKESPSLRQTLKASWEKVYQNARKKAQIETGLDIFPATAPFTLDYALTDPED